MSHMDAGEHIFKSMIITIRYKLSPLDLAGREKAEATVIEYEKFFIRNEKKILRFFETKKNKSSSDDITIRYLEVSQLNPTQETFSRAYYWAAFYDREKLIDMFLNDIGMTPFIGIYNGEAPVFGAI